MTEKTTNEKISDIIGFFLSLDLKDQEIVFKTLKDSMKKKAKPKKEYLKDDWTQHN